MSSRLKQFGPGKVVATNVVCVPFSLVNTYMVANRDGGWVLVDAGLFYSAGKILRAAEKWFPRRKPSAILLTHGHFDHRGALKKLAAHWDVPIYAHKEELPYLTGKEDYPAPDPTVGGGLITLMSWMFPHRGIDISDRVQPLPEDGSVPGMKEWRWIHTPGHSEGHVSYFHDDDQILVAGDAFLTVNFESLRAFIARKQQVHRPPAFLTPDWIKARRSVQELASLKPYNACTGHGIPMSGPKVEIELKALADNFNEVAVPKHGRFLRQQRKQQMASTSFQRSRAFG